MSSSLPVIGGGFDRSSVAQLLRILDRNLERYFLVILYFYTLAIITVIVISRYVFNYTPVWGADTAVFMYIYLTWIGAAWNIRKRRHIRVDIIQRKLSERGLGMTYILNDVATLVFVYFVLVGFVPIWENTTQLGASVQSLGVSQVWFIFAIPLGFFLITVRALQALYWDAKAVKNGTKVYRGESIIGGEHGSD